MDNSSEVRDFLTTRRERLTPDQAGIPLYGGRRRVKGLRREEVAMLAGMSTDYYTRLERGNLAGVSESVLEALARALQLDEAERAHLLDLAAAANAPGRPSSAGPRRPARPRGVREGVQRILDSISGPAYARNVRGDVVATNQLARALFADIYGQGGTGFNMARYLFLDPRSRDFFVQWETVARDSVAAMRIEAGRNPHDRALRTWSASCRPEARSSPPCGRPTTSRSTPPPPRPCTTPSSGNSNSPAKPCSCPETPA